MCIRDSIKADALASLGAIVAGGLVLWPGWAWADPIAALVIAAVAVKEGRDAWRGDTCCAPIPESRCCD